MTSESALVHIQTSRQQTAINGEIYHANFLTQMFVPCRELGRILPPLHRQICCEESKRMEAANESQFD